VCRRAIHFRCNARAPGTAPARKGWERHPGPRRFGRGRSTADSPARPLLGRDAPKNPIGKEHRERRKTTTFADRMKARTLKKTRVNVVTLGCSKNTFDSEVMMAQLAANGMEVDHASASGDHNVVVINTCGFIESAKQESIDT